MPFRTVGVKLTADAASYIATLTKAKTATEQFAGKSAAALQKNNDAINKVSTSASLIGAGLLLGVGAVIKSTAQFDKQMSAVAATGEGARQNIDALRKAAIDMGAQTAFSATEAAQGIENLLKAGVSAKDVLGGGLKGALDLAAAGNIEVGQAAEIAATAMTQFNLTGAQVPHIADLLAAGAGKAQGEVADMGMALKQGGLVASQFGLSIEDTVGTLSAFASAGLLGSDAGTSFKTMLLSLASPSTKAADEMERLGIAAYDSQGSFVGITNLAGQLHDKLGGVTQAERDAALATIFGNDAIRAANILYKQGSTGLAEWIKKTNDAGYAAKVARERLNNLSGDLEALKGSIESTFINSGSNANAALRDLTQNATDAVNAFGNLPKPVLQTGLQLTALAGIGLLAVGGLGKLATSGMQLRTAFREIADTSPRAAKGITSVGKAAGYAGAAVAGLTVFSEVSGWGKFRTDVDASADALIRLSQAGSRAKLNEMFTIWRGVQDDVNGFGDALQRVADPKVWDDLGTVLNKTLNFFGADVHASVISQLEQQFKSLDKAIASLSPEDAQRAFGDMRMQAEQAGVPIGKLVDLFPQYSQQVRDAAKAQGITITSTQQLADLMTSGLPPAALESAQALVKTARATGHVTSESKNAEKQIKEMVDQMFSAAHAALELQGSEDGLEAAIDDATRSVKDNGKTLDKNTEKGRNNRQSLRNLAEASIAYREKLIEQGAKQEKVTKTTERARAEFIRTAIKMGATRKEAEALADKFGLVDRKINGLNDKKVDIHFSTNAKGVYKTFKGFAVNLTSPSRVGGLREGGPVKGAGSGTSDSILKWLSNGEFVVNAKQTEIHRPLLEAINAGKMATGGYVNINPGKFPDGAMDVPTGANQFANAFGKATGDRLGKGLSKAFKSVSDAASAGAGGNLPGGGKAVGHGMNALFSYASHLGMGHSTYPGHGEKGMNKAWDFSPVGGGRGNALAGHAWRNAKQYGIWYVIWNRRIASRTRPGAGWRPYTRYGRNASPSQAHTNHVHISWYGDGTKNARKGLAVVGENGPELLNMRGGESVRPVRDYGFARSGMPATGWGSSGGAQVVHHHYINVAVNMPNGGNSEAQAAALGRRIASDLAAKGV